MTRSNIIWATAFVLAMDRPLPNDIPVVYEKEEPEPEPEEEENEPNS